DNFILDLTWPSIRKFLNYCTSKRYNNSRYEMPTHFKKYETIEEAWGNPFGNISLNIGHVCVACLRRKILRNNVIIMKTLRPRGHALPVSRDDKVF
ncbi:hypothetical protein MKX01_008574, partial [Papaver californicum]